MSNFILNIAVLSVPALLYGFMRHKWWWSWVLIVVTILAGLVQQVMIISDIWTLPIETKLFVDAWPLLAWLIWSYTLSTALTLRNVSVTQTAGLGLLTGQVTASLLLKDVEADGVRLTTVSWCGALLMPGAVLGAAQIWSGGLLWGLCWIPVSLILWRNGVSIGQLRSVTEAVDKPWMLWVAGLTLLLTSLMPMWGHMLMLVQVPIWIGLTLRNKRSFPWQHVVGAFGVFYLVNLAVAGGLAEAAGWGLEETPMDLHQWLPAGLVLGVSVATMMVGVVPTALFGMALLTRTMDLPSIGIRLDMIQQTFVLGLVLGNWNPWVMSKTWRQAWAARIGLSIVQIVIIVGILILLT